MNQQHRPARHRKADKLTHPTATGQDIRHDYACAAFDNAAREMDAAWGQDRLPELVSPATAEKFGSAMAKLNAAILKDDPTETAARAAVCIRGLAALDAEARAAGHQPTPPDAWRFDLDGQQCAIVRNPGDWTALVETMPCVRLYSLLEVANALRHYGGLVAAVKDAFPEATVTAIRRKPDTDLDDLIPY